jgi:hypothetical protein
MAVDVGYRGLVIEACPQKPGPGSHEVAARTRGACLQADLRSATLAKTIGLSISGRSDRALHIREVRGWIGQDRSPSSSSTFRTEIAETRHADSLQLANDAPISPVRVLVRKPEDHRTHRRLERRPPGLPMRVRPAEGDQLAVPAQHSLRLHGKACPRRPRQRLAQRCQQRPIGLCQLRPQAADEGSPARWRRTRISSSFERRGRPSSHISANRFRTTR